MIKCQNCGTQNFDVNTNCEKCNQPLKQNFYNKNSVSELNCETTSNPVTNIAYFQAAQKNNSLVKATKVFLVLSMVCIWLNFATFVILWFVNLILTATYDPFIFGIPSLCYCFFQSISLIESIILTYMIIHYFKKKNKGEPIGIAYKICTLIFVSPVAGILMLCDND